MKLKITLHGVAYEVEVEVLDAGDGFVPAATPIPTQAPVNNVAATSGPFRKACRAGHGRSADNFRCVAK
jgi:hypothetical protein